MKVSSKKTMLTATVLVTLSSGTAFAATPGTVDSQELFHSDRLVTDHVKNPAVEEKAAPNSYEASISARKNASASARQIQATSAPKNVQQISAAKTSQQQVPRLRWDDVDTRMAERNAQPSVALDAQKPKPVIITAEDIKREERLAKREGRLPRELVGDVNMNRPAPPPRPRRNDVSHTVPDSNDMSPVPDHDVPHVTPPNNASPAVSDPRMQRPAQTEPTVRESAQHAAGVPQWWDIQTPPSAQPAHTPAAGTPPEQKPPRSSDQQLPHGAFTPPADTGAVPKQPERFDVLERDPAQRIAESLGQDSVPVAEHTVRPEGVPEFSFSKAVEDNNEDLVDISDEVRRHILAGQLAMEVQLQRDPSVAGMRAITKVLRENTTLTRLQKIDFLIGFGRALHRSGLPRQQEAILIKTISELF